MVVECIGYEALWSVFMKGLGNFTSNLGRYRRLRRFLFMKDYFTNTI